MIFKKPDRRRMGRMSRTVMIMAGRKGKRPTNKNYFMQHRERILMAWSRINLEGRSQTWAPRNVLPSMFVKGKREYGEIELRFTQTNDALWRSILWQS